jgi:hypothetical protein
VEAPSLAFCPFDVNATIAGILNVSGVTAATKFDLLGSHALNLTHIYSCHFDRVCSCVDMSQFRLSDQSIEHPDNVDMKTSRDALGKYTTTDVFRESIQISTNLSDPSSEHVIKVGIFDSGDRNPDWFYVNQGRLFVAQLELMYWYVADFSIHGIINTVKGDLRAMVKTKHIYKYTSQEVGQQRDATTGEIGATGVRYEMKTFFVQETMSSLRAFSLYTIGVIALLGATSWALVFSFYTSLMPEYREKVSDIEEEEEPVVLRQLSPAAQWIRDYICCCLGNIEKDSPQEERAPLLPQKSQA